MGGGPILEHPAPASRSGQDSYVSKGGPLGVGGGVLLAVKPGAVLVFLQANSVR